MLQVLGITTGLSCGTQIANAFLVGLDQHVNAVLKSSIRLYKRFVDDVLIVHSQHISTADFVHVFNDWNNAINITHDSSEQPQQTTFLDLSLTVHGMQIHFETHRKPMNTYMYLPSNSCHNSRVFKAIVHTELHRLLITNMHEHNYYKHVMFFMQKLMHRGYSRSDFEAIVLKYPWHLKSERCSRSKKEQNQSLVCLKVKYFDGIEQLRFSSILNKHLKVLEESWPGQLKPILCQLSSPNLFRIRYQRFR